MFEIVTRIGNSLAFEPKTLNCKLSLLNLLFWSNILHIFTELSNEKQSIKLLPAKSEMLLFVFVILDNFWLTPFQQVVCC